MIIKSIEKFIFFVKQSIANSIAEEVLETFSRLEICRKLFSNASDKKGVFGKGKRNLGKAVTSTVLHVISWDIGFLIYFCVFIFAFAWCFVGISTEKAGCKFLGLSAGLAMAYHCIVFFGGVVFVVMVYCEGLCGVSVFGTLLIGERKLREAEAKEGPGGLFGMGFAQQAATYYISSRESALRIDAGALQSRPPAPR